MWLSSSGTWNGGTSSDQVAALSTATSAHSSAARRGPRHSSTTPSTIATSDRPSASHIVQLPTQLALPSAKRRATAPIRDHQVTRSAPRYSSRISASTGLPFSFTLGDVLAGVPARPSGLGPPLRTHTTERDAPRSGVASRT